MCHLKYSKFAKRFQMVADKVVLAAGIRLKLAYASFTSAK